MRIFAIADASKRKAKPIGLLTWEADPTNEQGCFVLELSSACDERDLPLSLSFCARKEGRRATPDESEAWVKSRIVPEDRHNIVEVLRANGLSRYDEVSLLASCGGRSSDDDFLAYEVQLTDEVADALARAGLGSAFAGGSDAPSRVDCCLNALERRRVEGRVEYAFVALPSAGEPDVVDGDAANVQSARISKPLSKPLEEPLWGAAAKSIGAQIKSLRKDAGLTQKQLAARAGITQTVLSRVESGSGNPTLELLEDIAAALGSHLAISLH